MKRILAAVGCAVLLAINASAQLLQYMPAKQVTVTTNKLYRLRPLDTNTVQGALEKIDQMFRPTTSATPYAYLPGITSNSTLAQAMAEVDKALSNMYSRVTSVSNSLYTQITNINNSITMITNDLTADYIRGSNIIGAVWNTNGYWEFQTATNFDWLFVDHLVVGPYTNALTNIPNNSITLNGNSITNWGNLRDEVSTISTNYIFDVSLGSDALPLGGSWSPHTGARPWRVLPYWTVTNSYAYGDLVGAQTFQPVSNGTYSISAAVHMQYGGTFFDRGLRIRKNAATILAVDEKNYYGSWWEWYTPAVTGVELTTNDYVEIDYKTDDGGYLYESHWRVVKE